MTHAYKIRSVDLSKGSFVIEFDGVDPLNFWIPFDENGYLTGDALEHAIQQLYPWHIQHAQNVSNFANGAQIASRVEPAPEPEKTAEQIRGQRNVFLTRSDWTQMPDAPLSAEQKAAWATYRQALRDITAQAGFPANVVWPTAPQ